MYLCRFVSNYPYYLIEGKNIPRESLRRTEGIAMQEAEQLSRFEEVILPHLDAAHNLARWLVRDDHDAEDIH